MNNNLKQAIKEAGANVLAANVFNIPVNWALLSIMIPLEYYPLTITLITTAVFTVIALVRFVSIRLYFNRTNA